MTCSVAARGLDACGRIKNMKIQTGLLNIDQLKTELEIVIDRFKSKNVQQVTVMYGFDCELDQDELYKEITIDVNDINTFIKRSENEGIYKFGDNDFYIMAKPIDMEFLFCHESDVHFTSSDNGIFAQIEQEWEHEGYEAYEIQARNAT